MLRLMKHLFWAAAFLFVSVAAFAQKVEFEANAPAVVAVGGGFPHRVFAQCQARGVRAADVRRIRRSGRADPVGRHFGVDRQRQRDQDFVFYLHLCHSGFVGRQGFDFGGVGQGGQEELRDAAVDDRGDRRRSFSPAGRRRRRKSRRGGAVGEAGGRRSAGADAVNRNNVFKKDSRSGPTFKIYTRVQLGGLDNVKYPAFNGFWVQDLDVQGYGWQRETLNGKVYDAKIIREVLLYPQQAGQLHIEQFSPECRRADRYADSPRGQSLFDDFFRRRANGEGGAENLSTAPVAITVKDFPRGLRFVQRSGRTVPDERWIDKKTMSANVRQFYPEDIRQRQLPLIQVRRSKCLRRSSNTTKKTTESLAHNANGITGYRQF